jgi:hypothetical protein
VGDKRGDIRLVGWGRGVVKMMIWRMCLEVFGSKGWFEQSLI